MTKQEQEKFIIGACETLRDGILKNLDKIPSNWDGWELRQYLKDNASTFVWDDMKQDRQRMREYKNDVIINGL